MAEELGFDTKEEAAASPEKEVRRWLLEVRLALKREKEWRLKAKGIIEKYRGTNAKKNSFNILWANTEVLRPALYNSTPKPDVRRRFRQEDKLGKAVSEVMERSTTYCVDAYDLDNCLRNDVLDALLPGRGTARIRYIPKFKAAEPKEGDEDEAFEGEREEVEYEQALCDHVQWDDFIHGQGKTWDEVPWVGFRCRLTHDDLVEKFGEEIAKEIKLGDVAEPELEVDQNKDIAGVFKRAECWEIWDKDSQRVFFLNESYRKGLIFPKVDGEPGTPPLKLKEFFPCPRPLMLVEDTGTLVPTPLYELYKEQAEELDRISARITKIVNACRVRFVYDSTLSELAELMKAGDNDGLPMANARAWLTNGGIDKAIWWMPIESVAAVLRELYVARDAAKQVIYEITGLSDIIRGVSDPNETLGAQKLKTNNSSLRLQRMQREVQRYVRDLIRLLAEVIGENFDPQTLSQMTGLKFPTEAEKQVAKLKLQAMQMQPGMPGQQMQQPQQQGMPGQHPKPGQPQQQPQVPPQEMEQIQQMLSMPSWEDVMGVLRSDMQREYRVDVETDSTVAQSLQQDMEGLREILSGLVEFWQGVGPAVMSGALKMDAVKSISMTIVRRARLGLEVEDAIESGMQQPKQQADPKAEAEKVKAQQEQQAQQIKAQEDQAEAQREHQSKAQTEIADVERERIKSEEKMQLDAQAKGADLEKHRVETAAKYDFERWKVEEDNRTKIEVAEISAKSVIDKAQVDAANAANDEEDEALLDNSGAKAAKKRRPIDQLSETIGAHLKQVGDMHGQTLEAIRGLAEARAKGTKARILRDHAGKAVGIETVA